MRETYVEIRYAAEPRDVGALLRHNLRHSLRLWLVLTSMALFPLGLGSLMAGASRRLISPTEAIVDLMIGIVLASLMLLRARWRTKRDERVLTIGPDGIRTSVGRLAGQVPWNGIADVSVTPEYIFITGKNTNGFAIPRRAFGSTEARDAFLRRVDEYRGAGSR